VPGPRARRVGHTYDDEDGGEDLPGKTTLAPKVRRGFPGNRRGRDLRRASRPYSPPGVPHIRNEDNGEYEANRQSEQKPYSQQQHHACGSLLRRSAYTIG